MWRAGRSGRPTSLKAVDLGLDAVHRKARYTEPLVERGDDRKDVLGEVALDVICRSNRFQDGFITAGGHPFRLVMNVT